MNWDKSEIKNELGDVVLAQAPIIISASRSTDIPAFYADWFVERWKAGYVKWKNPFNGTPLYVSFKQTRAVVFWSKNPKPMFKHLDFLDEHVKNYYFQFTLNDYDKEGFEEKVPKLESRINTFKELSNRIGKERVVWRFDPLILSDDITIDDLLNKIKNIGDQLKGYTEKLVFSYADIELYKKVKSNLIRNGIPYKDWTELQMAEFAERLSMMNGERGWNYTLATCCEKIDIEKKQGIINADDCNNIIKTLSYKSFESEYKIMIIWMVEKLFHSAAPKILKILEEPPEKTLFILISENQDVIINTILSRTQLVKIPKIANNDLYQELHQHYLCTY